MKKTDEKFKTTELLSVDDYPYLFIDKNSRKVLFIYNPMDIKDQLGTLVDETMFEFDMKQYRKHKKYVEDFIRLNQSKTQNQTSELSDIIYH